MTPSDIFKQPETSMPAVVGASKPSTRPSSAKPPSKPSDYFSVPRTASRPTSRSASRSTTHSASRSTALSTPRPLPSSSIAPGCQMATYPLATMYPPFYPQHLGAYYAIPQDAAFHHPALMGHHGGMVPAASPQAAHVPRYMPSSSSPDPGHYSSAQTQAANDLVRPSLSPPPLELTGNCSLLSTATMPRRQGRCRRTARRCTATGACQ